jgi:hypothetical protein
MLEVVLQAADVLFPLFFIGMQEIDNHFLIFFHYDVHIFFHIKSDVSKAVLLEDFQE